MNINEREERIYSVGAKTLSQMAEDLSYRGNWFGEPDDDGRLHRIDAKLIGVVSKGTGDMSNFVVQLGAKMIVFGPAELIYLRLSTAKR